MNSIKALRKPRIGIALGGGAARGCAHVGVLKAFVEHGIEISAISGTSIGSFVGALYAWKVPILDIEDLAKSIRWRKVSSIKLSRLGMLTNEDMGRIVTSYCGQVNIEDAPIPLAMLATDIVSGEPVVFREGDLARSLMASTAVPGVFLPVKMKDRLFVDGGMVENVPITPLGDMDVDITVAVNLGSGAPYEKPTSIIDVLSNAFDIAIDGKTELQLRKADVRIDVDLRECSRITSQHVDLSVERGYQYGCSAALHIKKMVSSPASHWLKRLWPAKGDKSTVLIRPPQVS